MASTYITHSTSTAHAGRLDNAVSQLRGGIAGLRELYGLMQTMKDGTSFVLIESLFGLDAGHGAVLFNLVKESIDLVDALDNGGPNKLQKLLTRVN